MQASPFSIRADDGVDLFVYRWLPEGAPKAVVQISHGLAEHAARYEPFAKALTEAGYAVYAGDHRGHGKTAARDEDLGYFADELGWEKAVADLERLSRRAREEHPGRPVVLFGHSMGSLLAQNYLFRFPDAVDAAVLSGTSGRVGLLAAVGQLASLVERRRVGPRGRSRLLHEMSFGQYNRRFKPLRTSMDWLSRDATVVDAYLADPQCGFVATTQLWSDLLRGIRLIEDPRNQAKVKKDLPIYIFSGELDPVGQDTKSVRQLLGAYGKAGLTHVEHRFYAGGRHEMLNEINRDDVIHDVIAWLDRVVARAQAERSAA
jgi:alpha-beta hydrolase superfamily lysophospholipase